MAEEVTGTGYKWTCNAQIEGKIHNILGEKTFQNITVTNTSLSILLKIDTCTS